MTWVGTMMVVPSDEGAGVGHLTSSGLKWQSDTERREHCAETRGRRGRRMNMR